VANGFNNRALLAAAQGEYPKAKLLYERAQAIVENALGPDYPEVANTLNNLGVLYFNRGQHALAEPVYRRALQIREKALGVDHPDVAGVLNNLAVLYKAQDRFGDALLKKQGRTAHPPLLSPQRPGPLGRCALRVNSRA
jgi:tetratricopeptide (TPR) repeat protein